MDIAAHCVQVPAGTGLAENEVKDKPEHERYPDGVVQAECFAVVEKVHESSARFTDGISIVVVVYNLGHAPGYGHGPQRCNEGR